MMLNVGNGSFVKEVEIEIIAPPESAPIKRMIGDFKDKGLCIDLTYGKKTKSVIVLRTGKIALSPITTNTLANNLAKLMDKE